MALPAVIFFIMIAYVPMAGIVIAFKDYDFREGIFGSPWVGFENFRFFLLSGKAWLITKNTVLYNLAFLFVGLIAEISVAVAVAEVPGRIIKKASHSMLFLPYFISWVLVGAFMYNLFNVEYGTINTVLGKLGLEPINVYGTPGAWKFILTVAHLWKWTGYGSVIYLAAIMGINPELYESASIDGATVFQQAFRITIPMLKPTILVLLLLNIGRILRGEFEMFYQMVGNNGQLFQATDIIDTFVFRSLIRSFDVSMASAANFYQSVFSFVTVVLSNRLVRRYDRDYALF
jgi:putative aldouronate transport system permease protein